MKTLIKVTHNGNLMFEGTVEDFQDCFFDNADPETISDWADEQGYEVVYKASNKEFK